MTKLTFYNGLREIGGTFVVVETAQTRCMFDFGFGVIRRLDSTIHKREGKITSDFVNLGALSSADGIYPKEVAKKLGCLAFNETSQDCFFLISHMHIDHMGALGLLDENIPVYMSQDSLMLYQHIVQNHDYEYGAHKHCIGIANHDSFTINDITVTVLPLDHDVVGACGFLIKTPDGTICYTGDYRFHGYHPESTIAFAQDAKNADILITEGVTASFEDIDMLTLKEPDEVIRTEYTLIEEITTEIKNSSSLLVINPYNRNIERIHNLLMTCEENGRHLVLDGTQADYVAAFYPNDDIYVYEETLHGIDISHHINWHMISQETLCQHSDQYVLQLDYTDLYELIDLASVTSAYIHMDGAPLGDYDPSYQKMLDFLELLHIPYLYKGIGGHSKPYYLRHMIDMIAPNTLIPLHSFRPEQVNSNCIKQRILPKYGETIVMEDHVVSQTFSSFK